MSRTKSAGGFNIDEFMKRQDDFGHKIINEENRSKRENKNIVNNLNGCLGRYKKIKNDVKGTDNNNVHLKDIIMAYQDLERDMMINKMIQDEKQKANGDEKQKLANSIRRESALTDSLPSNSEEVRASFSLIDNDIMRIDKRINDTMSELVKKTLHILVEVDEQYLKTINKDYIDDDEFQ